MENIKLIKYMTGGTDNIIDDGLSAIWDYDNFLVQAYVIGADRIEIEAYRWNDNEEVEILAVSEAVDIDQTVKIVNTFADTLFNADIDRVAKYGFATILDN